MKKWCVLYEVTTSHETEGIEANSLDEALALVREVLGEHINVTLVTTERGEIGLKSWIVGYNETISHEAVVEADTLEDAEDKVLMVEPTADIDKGWEVTVEYTNGQWEVLNEEAVEEEEDEITFTQPLTEEEETLVDLIDDPAPIEPQVTFEDALSTLITSGRVNADRLMEALNRKEEVEDIIKDDDDELGFDNNDGGVREPVKPNDPSHLVGARVPSYEDDDGVKEELPLWKMD